MVANLCSALWLSLLLLIGACAEKLAVVILSQDSAWNKARSLALKEQLLRQAKALHRSVDVFLSHEDLGKVVGHWAVWPLFPKLAAEYSKKVTETPDWLLICEPDTEIRVPTLLKFLKNYDESSKQFLGKGLRDQEPTIIHHYAGAGEDRSEPPFLYPDFASGVALSWPLVLWLSESATRRKKSDFTIDAKHELAVMINEAGVRLTASKQFCTLDFEESCVTIYRHPDRTVCSHHFTWDDVYFGVKTFSGYHKDRIVVVKRTWAKEAKHIEYYSDIVDRFVPTIDVGQESASRGHCGKTFAILERFTNKESLQSFDWLVVADDDTLICVPRLLKLLSCYDASSAVIIGEKYGYGFRADGESGYDYPTGGSGMVFSRPAVRSLLENCNCPSLDSPDDMIIGMCAKSRKIPVIHSAAFHQARPNDYSVDYVKRIPPISFHKHTDVDPYLVYLNHLDVDGENDNENAADAQSGFGSRQEL